MLTQCSDLSYACRLGQACNHIAALLFYIDYHSNDADLPTDKSKTSIAMTWNQPPKKVVTPARATSMTFVKPSHGDDPEHKSQRIKLSTFDPRQHQHRILDTNAVDKLLYSVQDSVPSTGLQQFWRSCNTSKVATLTKSLWSHVIYSQIHPMTLHRFSPSTDDCHKYLDSTRLPMSTVEDIEIATRDQSDCELWYALRNGRVTSSRFGEILHRRPTTNSRRLVKDIMGYGGPIKCSTPAMRWGKDNEETVHKIYVDNRAAEGENMIVT